MEKNEIIMQAMIIVGVFVWELVPFMGWILFGATTVTDYLLIFFSFSSRFSMTFSLFWTVFM